MKDKKGFTLIELMIVLGLAGIVLSVVMSFFIANYKSYETINTESELQYQSQYIINFMTNKILEAKQVVSVNKNINYLNDTSETNIDFISFQYGKDDKECYNFKVENNQLYFGDGQINGVANSEIGSKFDDLIIKIIPIDDDFKNTNSIKINLKIESRNRTNEAEQVVYMRNSN